MILSLGITPKRYAPFGSSNDADAQAFITAAGITDGTQQSAVNQLVLDLKSASIWTKMKAIYPIVGGSAATHKWNLKDPRDLDAAFRLNFTVGWTHSSTGMKPTNAYANTYLIQNVSLSQNNFGFSIYSRTNKTGNSGVSTGIVEAAGYTQLYLKNSANNTSLFMNNLSQLDVANTDSRGFFQSIRTSSTSVKQIKNNIISNFSSASTINHTTPFYIGARNQTGVGASSYDNCEYSFISYNDGLTDTEASNLYTAVQNYNTTLGRNV